MGKGWGFTAPCNIPFIYSKLKPKDPFLPQFLADLLHVGEALRGAKDLLLLLPESPPDHCEDMAQGGQVGQDDHQDGQAGDCAASHPSAPASPPPTPTLE